MDMGQKNNWITLSVACIYLVPILIMWLPFGPFQGMPYETTLVYSSETSSLLGGFIYGGDPLKPHTSTFYHLSYLLGEIIGMEGSFLPYQIVYVLLWWGRGILVFLIGTQVFAREPIFCLSRWRDCDWLMLLTDPSCGLANLISLDSYFGCFWLFTCSPWPFKTFA